LLAVTTRVGAALLSLRSLPDSGSATKRRKKRRQLPCGADEIDSEFLYVPWGAGKKKLILRSRSSPPVHPPQLIPL